MSQTITLPDKIYGKLKRGAAERGLTIESLLEFVSEFVQVPEKPSKNDREIHRQIESLVEKHRQGTLTEQDRAELSQLIDADYQKAIDRADRIIAERASGNSSPASPKRTRE